ncbi:CACTA en-spm transposon protein [Cucumis melo var. makuwa]|uniref:CACTA en-spm transposon protein n=1 Tax=Cucumis melo var. makuwa TaxID=1194695 RepID=A0A5A7T3B6_CUCMM|nr:CACTA en-spm transposon protein [Cucumis melo var. makuwa]TYK30438.1 CACTA en-spm transposon protein [Cucumis melo var. makuwa]
MPSPRCRCPRHREPAVVPLSPSATAHPYLRGGSRIACKVALLEGMLNTFKEFQGDCHRNYKKYSDSEEARANPPHLLMRRDENLHFFCDHYMSRAFHEQSQTNKAAR